MTREISFHIQDVTCEKCEARLQSALAGLPGVEDIRLTRAPQDEADVLVRSRDDLARAAIEEVVEKSSAGTTHNYRVRWQDS
jgi:copper chaperone CopZ